VNSDQFSSIQTTLAQWRQNITERILAVNRSPVGAIAAALMTGDRSAIPEDIMKTVRDSGLAHLLAISGLHIGLVAGILFIGFRALFVLLPYIALNFPIKKWAAAFAIPGALAYALISGASIPTLRAFLMITLVLLAVMLDRRGISMRMVAWTAAIVLLFQPESVLGASFQMSFSAVVALIAVYEFVSMRRLNQEFKSRTLIRTFGLYVGGVALTTLVSGLATAPFAIFHFNRFALYGLAANLIAVPITALWIMPWAVLVFILMPFGLEGFALTPMFWGIEVVLKTAQFVSQWPGAAITLPAMSTEALLSVTCGLLWLCLWRSRWRLFGTVGIAAGLATLLLYRAPDILVDGDAKLMAVRLVNGQYAVTSLRRKKYTREVWLRRIGHSGPPVPWPKKKNPRNHQLSCDGQGCLYRTQFHVVSLAIHPGALLEDCYTTSLIISTFPIRQACRHSLRTIDRFDLWRDGAHAVWLEKNNIRVESVNAWRGHRPWVLKPENSRGVPGS
jgi:competence protein ComEC